MAYNPDFTRNPKGQFNLNNNFVSIKSGSEAYLIEDELNEIQWIQNEQRAQEMRSLFGSGLLYKSLGMLDTNTNTDESIYVKGYGNTDLNSNAVLFNIKNYIPININGYFLKLAGTYKKDVSGLNTANNNILVTLPSAATLTPRYDLAYLEVWFEEIDSNINTAIKSLGGVRNSDIGPFVNDGRLNVETTRRIQLKWDIVTVAGAQNVTDSSVHPRSNSSNTNYVAANTISNQSYSKDNNLFVSINNTGVIDKTYYAIPLFSIYRLVGQTTFQASNFLSIAPVTSIATSSINGNTLTIGTDPVSGIILVNDGGNLDLKNSLNKYISLKINDLILDDNISESNNVTLHNNTGTLEIKSIIETSGYADVIVGNLTVKGTTTSINSEIVTIADGDIILNSNVAATTTPTENGGMQINRGNSVNSSLLWNESLDKWQAGLFGSESTIILSSDVSITSGANTIPKRDATETLYSKYFSGKLIGNADTASILLNARTITLSGSVTGSASFDGSTNINIVTTMPTIISDLTIATGKSLYFGPATENTDTIRLYRNNASVDASTLILELGDNPGVFSAATTDVFVIQTTGGTIRHSFASDGSYTASGNITCVGNLQVNTDITCNGNITTVGNITAAKIFNAVYNDYAEYFEKGESVEPGDVVTCCEDKDNMYIKSNTAYSKCVVGVYSDSFGQCMGGKGNDKDADDFIPVGLAGRVMVKVTGDVSKGDLLVSSSIPGVAMKSEEYIPGTVIGKALENNSGQTINKIKMFIVNM